MNAVVHMDTIHLQRNPCQECMLNKIEATRPFPLHDSQKTPSFTLNSFKSSRLTACDGIANRSPRGLFRRHRLRRRQLEPSRALIAAYWPLVRVVRRPLTQPLGVSVRVLPVDAVVPYRHVAPPAGRKASALRQTSRGRPSRRGGSRAEPARCRPCPQSPSRRSPTLRRAVIVGKRERVKVARTLERATRCVPSSRTA